MEEKHVHHRVMIIDDSDLDRFIAATIMRTCDFAKQVISMPCSLLALEFLKSADADKLPTLIFLDINMPVANGFEFLEQYDLLADHHKKAPIVMLSSSIYKEDEERSMAHSKVIAYLSKPLTETVLASL